MLPYSPLHHVLLADAGTTLVMTSGNVSDEPIAFRDEDACERLADIADVFLLHDRPIETRTDDSVVRHADGRRMLLRRSRGYVPDAIAAAARLRPAPARLRRRAEEHVRARQGRQRLGGPPRGRPQELRDAALVRRRASTTSSACSRWSPRWWRTTCTPSTSPRSTRSSARASGWWACSTTTPTSRRASPSTARRGPAVGAIFDGTGYGEDGTVWGGELLFGDLADFERAGMLFPVRMPGGEAAIRQPWRMACAWLAASFDEPPRPPRQLARQVEQSSWDRSPSSPRTGWPRRSPPAPAGCSTPLRRSAACAPR